MGFNPLDLMHGIEKDISDADEIFIHLQDEAKLLSEISTSYELGSGKAIDSFKSVLADVRLSAVYLYQDANMAFTEDARKDLRMAKRLLVLLVHFSMLRTRQHLFNLISKKEISLSHCLLMLRRLS